MGHPHVGDTGPIMFESLHPVEGTLRLGTAQNDDHMLPQQIGEALEVVALPNFSIARFAASASSSTRKFRPVWPVAGRP
jgi:hypothetical protein